MVPAMAPAVIAVAAIISVTTVITATVVGIPTIVSSSLLKYWILGKDAKSRQGFRLSYSLPSALT